MTRPTAYGKRLKNAREALHLSLAEAAEKANAVLDGARRTSYEKIRLMENGTRLETSADPIVLAALARVYGKRLEELSPLAAATISSYRDLLGDDIMCFPGFAEMRRLAHAS